MVPNPLATAKTNLGLGGDATATAGATTGAVDGNNGGGNDSYDMVEVDRPSQEEGSTDDANAGAANRDVNTSSGGAQNALATAKRSSARLRTPTFKAMESAAQKAPPKVIAEALAGATSVAATLAEANQPPTSTLGRISTAADGSTGQSPTGAENTRTQAASTGPAQTTRRRLRVRR